ncbi:unnamed protein product [Ixodes pacificus]
MDCSICCSLQLPPQQAKTIFTIAEATTPRVLICSNSRERKKLALLSCLSSSRARRRPASSIEGLKELRCGSNRACNAGSALQCAFHRARRRQTLGVVPALKGYHSFFVGCWVTMAAFLTLWCGPRS